MTESDINQTDTPEFIITPLGMYGGEIEGNCTAVLIEVPGDEHFIMLDAGTVVHGVQRAVALKQMEHIREAGEHDSALVGRIVKHKISSYLITHAHLDHINGLVLHSDMDTQKAILGIEPTIENLRDHIFNWKIWPNFCNEGEQPLLGQYQYQRLALEQWQDIPNSSLQVKSFLLDHYLGYPCTAFLLSKNNNYLLYIGDTGADSVQDSDNLLNLWRAIAPLVANNYLKSIIFEVTFANQRPDDRLFGHLTPHLAFEEFRRLVNLVRQTDPDTDFSQLSLIPVHFKPSFLEDVDMVETVKQELLQENDIGCRIVIPEQGMRIFL